MKHQNTPTNTQMIESVIDVFAEELKEIRDSAREDYYYETHGMSDDIDMAYVKATEAIESLISEAVNKARIEEELDTLNQEEGK